MTLRFEETELAEQRRVNRLLASTPRYPLRSAWDVAVLNGAIRLSQALPVPNYRRLGVELETRRIEALGRGVDVRILKPSSGPCRGVFLDVHGGAWVLGNARMDDAINAEIVKTCGVAVVSVDYRIQLDNAVLAALEDCETAAVWALEHLKSEFDAETLLMGGESAGAHLVASTLIRLRDRGLVDRVAGAVLFYGCYDLHGTPSLHAAGADTLILHGPTLASALHKLMPNLTPEERRDPSLSPLYADLSGLPQALFLVGAKDPLLDDTQMLAARWEQASGNAELVLAPEAPHGFNRLPTALARKTNAYVRGWLFARSLAQARALGPTDSSELVAAE